MPDEEPKLKIELAPHEEVDAHGDFVDEFMGRVLGIDEFLITDESSMSDFRDREIDRAVWMNAMYANIRREYGTDVTGLDRLIDIFNALHTKGE